MQLSEILSLERTCFDASVKSKKKALELIAELIANDYPNIQSHEIFDALVEREKLGSTGMTDGIAIPHARVKSANEVMCSLVLLKENIDFDSLDNNPVKLLVALIVPEDATDNHLQTLSYLAEKLHNKSYRESLMQATSKEDLFQQAIS